MVLAVILLFYIAAAILYFGINRKSPPTTHTGTAWAGNAAPQTRHGKIAAAKPSIDAAITPAKIINAVSLNNELKPLLQPAQRLFYSALKQAAAASHEVFIKIPIADLFTLANFSQSGSAESFRLIASEYFDFVICRNDSLTVIAAFRFNGLSDQPDKALRDKMLRAACKARKIPLVVIKEQSQYDIEQLRRLIALL
jgi:hypothetical protein